MRSYEKILIVGNIGSVEQLHSKAGNSYLRMSVAVNRSTGNQNTSVWYSVLLFGKMAENVEGLMRVLTKGRQVLVEGRPQTEAFIKKDGTAGVDNSIIAEKLPLLMDAPPPQAAAQAAQRAAA
jgi:single stranded DNA-binding protein